MYKVFDFDSKCSLWRFRCPLGELQDLLASDDPESAVPGKDNQFYERMKYSPEFSVGGTKFRLHLQLRRVLHNTENTAEDIRRQICLGVHLQCLTYDLRGVFAHFRITLNNHSIRAPADSSADNSANTNSKAHHDPLHFEKISKTYHCHFKKYGSAWGTQSFAPIEQIMGPANGYIDHSLQGVDSMPCEFDCALHTLSSIRDNVHDAIAECQRDEKKLHAGLALKYADQTQGCSSSILKKVLYFPSRVAETPCVVFDIVLRVLEPDQTFIAESATETRAALLGRMPPLPEPSLWAGETLEKIQLNKMYNTFYDQFDNAFDAASKAISTLKANVTEVDQRKESSRNEKCVVPAVIAPANTGADTSSNKTNNVYAERAHEGEWDHTWSTPPPDQPPRPPQPSPGCARLQFPYEDTLCDMRIALGSFRPLLRVQDEKEGAEVEQPLTVTDDNSVLCHRAVITSRVPQLIPVDVVVLRPGEVLYIPEVSDMAVLYCFLQYIYTEELSLAPPSDRGNAQRNNTHLLDLSPTQIIDLYVLSKAYELPHLGDECLMQLVPRLDDVNILNVIACRFLPDDETLNIIYLRVLLSAYDKVIINDSFMALPGQLNRRLSLLIRCKEPIPPLRRPLAIHPAAHTKSLCSQLSLLASTGLYSDYDLVVGSVFAPYTIRTHKVVLASRSEAFFNAFYRRPKQLIAAHKQQEEQRRAAYRQQRAQIFMKQYDNDIPSLSGGDKGHLVEDTPMLPFEGGSPDDDILSPNSHPDIYPIPVLTGPDYDFPLTLWQRFLGALYRGSYHRHQSEQQQQEEMKKRRDQQHTQATMTPEDVVIVWKLTDVLELDGKLRQESLASINAETALSLLIYAEKHNCEALRDVALGYVAKDLSAALNKAAWNDPPNTEIIANLRQSSLSSVQFDATRDTFSNCTWGVIAALPYPALMKLFKTVMAVAE